MGIWEECSRCGVCVGYENAKNVEKQKFTTNTYKKQQTHTYTNTNFTSLRLHVVLEVFVEVVEASQCGR